MTFTLNGRVTNLTEKDGVKDLVTACEDALVSSPSMTRLAVSSETIKGIRKTDASVEVKFAQPKELVIAASGRKIVIDRLLIPLSGEYAVDSEKKKFVMVFYGNTRYEHGPYSNSGESNKRITSSLEKLGVKLP